LHDEVPKAGRWPASFLDIYIMYWNFNERMAECDNDAEIASIGSRL
jgi:hypothetical protein